MHTPPSCADGTVAATKADQEGRFSWYCFCVCFLVFFGGGGGGGGVGGWVGFKGLPFWHKFGYETQIHNPLCL